MRVLGIMALCAGVLAGCNTPSFNREAGDMDTGSFGNAIMHNTLMATGARASAAPVYGSGKYTGPVSANVAGAQFSGKAAAAVMQSYQTEQAARIHPSGQGGASLSSAE